MKIPDSKYCGRTAWLVAGAWGVALLLFLHIHGHVLLHLRWMVCLLWVFLSVALAEWWRRRRARNQSAGETEDGTGPGFILFVFLGLYLFSSATFDRNFYFLGWPPVASWRARLSDSWPAIWLMIGALLTPFLLPRWRKVWLPVLLVLLGATTVCLYRFWSATQFAPLYSDDHPSFLLRLWILGHNLPRLAAYLPFWNGGVVEARVVSSGALSLGTVLWPLWRFGDMTEVYTPGLALLFLGMVPVLAAGSVRIVGGSWTAALAAAVLSLGISRLYFVWLLHFGTVASVACAPFLMPVCACLYRVLWRDGREFWVGLVLVLSACLYLAWPASVMMSTPLALGILFSLRAWSRPKIVFLAACAIALALLMLPQVLTIFRHTDVSGFAQMNAWKTWSLKDAILDGTGELKDHLRQAHPALIFLGLAGVWLFPQRGLALFYGSILAGLALLSGWGEEWKPQYSLGRTGIPLFFVATLPAGLWLGRFLENQSVRWAPIRASILALLILAGLNTAKFYGNKTIPKYRVMGDEINNLADWITQHVPAGGRVLFAGYTIHGVGGGHVAFLPILTGREMMACDYYHFSPNKVEYEYPPKPFRNTPEGMLQFAELYNVTHVITFHPEWLEFFRNHPEQYEEQLTFGNKTKKVIFKVNRTADQFLKGQGTVRSDLNRLQVHVDNPDQEIVLKYNWDKDLVADDPVRLQPFEVNDRIRLIAAQPNGRSDFTIQFKAWY